MHFAPEIGYFLSPELLLSVQFRYQLVSGANEFHSTDSHGVRGRHLLARHLRVRRARRISYLFGEGDFRTYVSGIGGLGTIRHVASFESQQVCGAPVAAGMSGNQVCIDTVPSGPIFVGAGLGVFYNLSPAFALTLGTNALLGFTKFTFHVDLNLGLAFFY